MADKKEKKENTPKQKTEKKEYNAGSQDKQNCC
uniref:Uncharacterized protein n=1 Tax=uncultured Ignavibacteria bacterium Rifle_16ft_4_minimus_20697 TaxID=1665100 RepID=A0A0H4T5C7_9BACT|nr:hypothetical protein [uncultured Ignavibacteria bacterium Rifle_16ft_4_minimus_20697]